MANLKWGCQLSRVRVAEDHTTTGNGARFNFRVRNGIGWVPRPMAGKPQRYTLNHYSLTFRFLFKVVFFASLLFCQSAGQLILWLQLFPELPLPHVWNLWGLSLYFLIRFNAKVSSSPSTIVSFHVWKVEECFTRIYGVFNRSILLDSPD
jgi:hypothetical protein